MVKKILVAVFLLVAIGATFLVLRGDEDVWVCDKNQWEKHGNPKGSPPNEYCGDVSNVLVFKLFFPNKNTDPNFLDCTVVSAVERRVLASDELIYKTAVSELLIGPSTKEAEDGYFSSINSGVKILDLNLSDKETAVVNFSKEIEQNVGGSCRVASIRSQIESTLKQFSNIKNVIIKVEGRVDDVLQP